VALGATRLRFAFALSLTRFLFSSGDFSNDRRPRRRRRRAVDRGARIRPLGSARRHYVAGAFAVALGVLIKTSTLPGLAAAVT
jgi:hypothetical protein